MIFWILRDREVDQGGGRIRRSAGTLNDRAGAVVVTSDLAVAEVLRVVRRSNHNDQGVVVDVRQLDAELDEARTALGRRVDRVRHP